MSCKKQAANGGSPEGEMRNASWTKLFVCLFPVALIRLFDPNPVGTRPASPNDRLSMSSSRSTSLKLPALCQQSICEQD